ncbi:MAG: SH3 domain-containing protein [Sphingomonadaceae bacterium]
MRGLIAAAVALALLVPEYADAQRNPPYFASLGASKARMRTGPGREFPAVWLYQRAGLPVRVIETYHSWRKIEDPDGATGWMQANLLNYERMAIVTGGIRELRAAADPEAAVVWRAEPGVVGRLIECARGWCLLDVKGRNGYVATAHLWGVTADEKLP